MPSLPILFSSCPSLLTIRYDFSPLYRCLEVEALSRSLGKYQGPCGLRIRTACGGSRLVRRGGARKAGPTGDSGFPEGHGSPQGQHEARWGPGPVLGAPWRGGAWRQAIWSPPSAARASLNEYPHFPMPFLSFFLSCSHPAPQTPGVRRANV